MSVTVTNTSRQPVNVVLDHPAFFTKEAGWQRTTASFRSSDEDGNITTQEVRRAFPASLTLMPGESVSELHAAFAKCTQVPALIARKVLSVKIIKENDE